MVVRLILALLLVPVFASTGCGGGGDSSRLPNPTVRFINGSPDSAALNFFIDDEVKGLAVPYLGSSPGFSSFSSGERDVRLIENGAVEELSSEAFTFGLDRHYVSVAAGLVNYGTENLKRVRSLTFEVDRTLPNGNKARIYVVHAYHRTAGLETPAIDFQSPGDNPLFRLQDIAFAGQKSMIVDSGTQTFEVRRAGTENVLVSASTALNAGGIYVALVSGIEDAPGAQAPSLTFLELQPE